MYKINGYKISGNFPTIITPENSSLTYEDFLQSIINNQIELKILLLKTGAIIFRDFPIQNSQHFSALIDMLKLGEKVNYIGGDSPRDKLSEKIYTSTEAPPHFHIPLHQELSFMKKHPRHIYFYCETAAEQGGATIIGDARNIYRALNKQVIEHFENQQLTYTSRYYYQSKIMAYVNRVQRSHKSWTEVFETHDKQEVEAKCLHNEFSYQWLKHDWIKLNQTRPAIISHPISQEKVWFNQAHLYDFNPRLLGYKNYLAAKLFYFRRSTRLHEVHYANGKKIPRDYLYHILDTLDEQTVATPWQRGDVMVLDNILTMHGREPFVGKRKVLTAMTR